VTTTNLQHALSLAVNSGLFTRAEAAILHEAFVEFVKENIDWPGFAGRQAEAIEHLCDTREDV